MQCLASLTSAVPGFTDWCYGWLCKQMLQPAPLLCLNVNLPTKFVNNGRYHPIKDTHRCTSVCQIGWFGTLRQGPSIAAVMTMVSAWKKFPLHYSTCSLHIKPFYCLIFRAKSRNFVLCCVHNEELVLLNMWPSKKHLLLVRLEDVIVPMGNR